MRRTKVATRVSRWIVDPDYGNDGDDDGNDGDDADGDGYGDGDDDSDLECQSKSGVKLGRRRRKGFKGVVSEGVEMDCGC